jgi:hypothetical protein
MYLTDLHGGRSMKKILYISMLMFSSIGIFAQEKNTVQAKFEAIYKNSFNYWSGKPYRRTITTFSGTEGQPEKDYNSKSILESASATRSRLIYENSFQTKIRRSETIRIEDKVYSRNDDEPWKKGVFQPKSQNENKAKDSTKDNKGQIEYKFLGTEKLENQTANVFATITRYYALNPVNNEEKKSEIETKYWFAEDGSILKKESIHTNKVGEKTYFSRITETWESDSNIKIEIPKEISK